MIPFRWLIVSVCLLFNCFPAEAGEILTSSEIPALVSAIRIQDPVDFCGEPVPIDDPEVRERLEKEMLLSLWDRAQVILWIKRTARYFPHIEEVLRSHDLPSDLKYVAVAESALRPHAGSHKGAIGFWQFMRYTGKKYGLTVDRHTDDRRSLYASTEAAAKYFRELYDRFGSWTLAAAAYNMGEHGLEREIREQDTDNFYRLYLSLETQRYIFKILSIKLILAHPEKYGFHLSPSDLYPPSDVEPVSVRLKQDTAILDIARAAGTDYKAIKDLNPQIRGRYVPEGNHTIILPTGTKTNFSKKLQSLSKRKVVAPQPSEYTIQKGDNLTAIANRHGVPLGDLLRWNNLSMKKPIHPGQRIVIYRK